jgi:hypothetical protein
MLAAGDIEPFRDHPRGRRAAMDEGGGARGRQASTPNAVEAFGAKG